MGNEPNWSAFYDARELDHASLCVGLAQENARRDAQAHARLSEELRNFRVAANRLYKKAQWSELLSLTTSLWEESSFLPDRGPEQQNVSLLKEGLEAARALNDDSTICARLISLGEALRGLGQIEPAIAHFDEALTLARQQNDLSATRTTLCQLGMAWIDRDVSNALIYLKEAETLSDTVISPELEIDLLSGLAVAQTQQGEVEAAADYLERGIRLAQTQHDERRRADLIYQRAYLRTALSDFANARADFEEAANVFQALGHTFGYGRALQAMGGIDVQMGQTEQGETELKQAFHILEQAGDEANMPSLLASLGQAYILLNKLEQARTYLERALDVLEKYKEIPTMAALEAPLRQMYDELLIQLTNQNKEEEK